MEEWEYYVTDCKLAAGVKYKVGHIFALWTWRKFLSWSQPWLLYHWTISNVNFKVLFICLNGIWEALYSFSCLLNKNSIRFVSVFTRAHTMEGYCWFQTITKHSQDLRVRFEGHWYIFLYCTYLIWPGNSLRGERLQIWLTHTAHSIYTVFFKRTCF